MEDTSGWVGGWMTYLDSFHLGRGISNELADRHNHPNPILGRSFSISI